MLLVMISVPVFAQEQKLTNIVSGENRSAKNKARDVHRHPAETLSFLGLKDDMTVVEIWPGAGMWYTEILAPYLKDNGQLYTASWGANYQGTFSGFLRRAHGDFIQKLRSNADVYDEVIVSTLNPPHKDQIAPDGSVDMVLTFRNLHNWLAWETTDQTLAAIHRSLKPGGILGVTDHRAPAETKIDPRSRNGYVNQQRAIELIEAAGFKLVAKSDINANPKDTAEYEQGVWTLPPSYRLGDVDREKYTQIGESDRFTLKFIKR